MSTTIAATSMLLGGVPAVTADPPTGPTGQPLHVRQRSRGVQVAGRRQPLPGNGGGWTELIELPDGALGVAAAGAQGHDRTAAGTAGLVHGRLRARAIQGWGPSSVLEDVDQLVQTLDRTQLDSGLYGRLVRDGDGAMLRYTNAGHLPPLVQDPDGSTRLLDGAQGLTLGAPPARCDATRRTEACAVLAVGATLLLYTAGLVDRPGRSLDHGLAQLRITTQQHAPARGPAALCHQLLQALAVSTPTVGVSVLAVRILP